MFDKHVFMYFQLNKRSISVYNDECFLHWVSKHFLGSSKCKYKSPNYIVKHDLKTENVVGLRRNVPFDDCKISCDQTRLCKSFSFCNGICELHDIPVTGKEHHESMVPEKCFTTYKSCGTGIVKYTL